jgi:DNA-binding CsgD family transcriptional regulator
MSMCVVTIDSIRRLAAAGKHWLTTGDHVAALATQGAEAGRTHRMMLAERETQAAIFESAIMRCTQGSGTTFAVTGPPVSGKTALLRSFIEQAAGEGYLVLGATGVRSERRLVLSLLDQLPHAFALPQFSPAARSQLLAYVQGTAGLPDLSADASDRELAHMLQVVTNALFAMGERTPVLIAIDDLHHADPVSLRCLVYLARRIGLARIVLVMCGTDLVEPTDPELYGELLDHSTERTSLAALSPEAVAQVLRHHAGEPSPAVVHASYAATGGNPLLVNALAQDLAAIGATGMADGAGVEAGPAYGRAVARCLERCDRPAQQVLHAAAVLSQAPPPALPLLARVADVDAATAKRRVADLTAIGLLRQGVLPHPTARQAVLDSMPAGAQAALHLRTARLLHDEGAAPVAIAGHLVDAGGEAGSWALPILRTAATQMLAKGEAAAAVAFLRVARDSTTDAAELAAVRAMLLQAEWHADPASAGHRLPDLTAAVHGDLLPVPHALRTVRSLVWLGQTKEAVAVLGRLSNADADAEQRAEIRFTTSFIAHTHPGLAEHLPPATDDDRPPVTSTRDQLATALEAIFSRGVDGHALTVAEQALQRCALDDSTLAPVIAALSIMTYADDLEAARLWCDRLIAEARERGAHFWQAVLSDMRAGVALRQGKLDDAERFAKSALAQISRESWGTAVASPVASLLQALTAMGRLEEAERLLEVPVPEEAFQTIWGLSYLQARGRYYLAANRPQAALDDFLTCGELMGRWKIDQPALVPWRADTAQAYVALGKVEQARSMAKRQLTDFGQAPTGTKGRALRLLASTHNLAQRLTLLRKAVEILRASGDHLELAYTLADLSQVHRDLGDTHRARLTVRRAWHLASECHADALCQTLLPDIEHSELDPPPEADNDALSSLSDAERRVAALAAQGNTNRQIANKLFVTLSTVEQHLTRVYRKLNVSRRTELLVKLPAELSNVA